MKIPRADDNWNLFRRFRVALDEGKKPWLANCFDAGEMKVEHDQGDQDPPEAVREHSGFCTSLPPVPPLDETLKEGAVINEGAAMTREGPRASTTTSG